ncbi:MAG: hypothetical protein EBZ48_05695, partial [Proteobacteria bacterium]|nr:hypothetical protein [Pseudomonadota bacterium]
SSSVPGYYRIDRLAWAIGILSLVGALGLIYFCIQLSSALFKRFQLERISHSMQQSDPNEALDELQQLLDGPPLLSRLPGAPRVYAKVPRQSAESLIETIGLLSPDTISGAAQRLTTAVEQARLDVHSSANAISQIEQLRSSLKPILDQITRLDQLRNQKNVVLKSRSATLSQFDLLARDTAELFSLPPHAAETNGADPLFYDEGILQGLPLVTGIPDNITSLEDLRAQLQTAGGRLKTSGAESLDTILSGQITSLRQAGYSVATNLGDLDIKLSELSGAIESEHDQIQRNLGLFSSELRDKIQELLK